MFCTECGAKLKGNEAAPEPVNVAEPVMEATPMVASIVALVGAVRFRKE